MRAKTPSPGVHGVVLVDKPLGLTSQSVVSRLKRLYGAHKAGHAGTLDPMATGLLPICLGAATKFSQSGLEADKAYEAIVRLGQTRVGGDMEGEIIAQAPVDFVPEKLEIVLRRFTGAQQQIPPMHSALKVQGRPLYAYARQGIDIDRQPRHITIHELRLLSRTDDSLNLFIRCSKGTYIRTLAEDIGQALGCGAHLTSLRRVAIAHLNISQAYPLDDLLIGAEQQLAQALRPVDSLVSEWPVVTLNHDDAARFLCGMRRQGIWKDTACARVYGPENGAFLGTGHIVAGELIADRLLSPSEVSCLLH